MNSMSDYKIAKFEINNGKANVLNENVFREIKNKIEEFEQSQNKVLIITGTDNFFSSGLDLTKIYSYTKDELRSFMTLFEDTLISIYKSKKPIITAINGHAIAGGLVIALQADYTIGVDKKYKLGLIETKLGLGLPLLPLEALKLKLSYSSFIDVAYFGETFSPSEAHTKGLINDLVSQDEYEQAIMLKAKQLSEIPSKAFEQIKYTSRMDSFKRIEENRTKLLENWLDTWFSEEAQNLIKKQVELLS